MAPMVTIDGLRAKAERSGRYAPGQKTVFDVADEGHGALESATAFVKKQTIDGTWHEVAEEAFFDEYAAKKKDGELTQMWATKPRIMLAKCAEARALRRAFPEECEGMYTSEEMEQAGHVPVDGISSELKPLAAIITEDLDILREGIAKCTSRVALADFGRKLKKAPPMIRDALQDQWAKKYHDMLGMWPPRYRPPQTTAEVLGDDDLPPGLGGPVRAREPGDDDERTEAF
jgi:hypothetical protein